MRVHGRIGRSLGLLCVLGSQVGASPQPDETRAVEWVLTHGPSVDLPTDTVRALVADGSREALDRLRMLGEPARRALLHLASGADDVAERASRHLEVLQCEEDRVERSGLASSISGLLARGPRAAARARRIAPADAPESWDLSWWIDRVHAYRFAPAVDRFLAWQAWAEDAAPLRFHGRNRVVLDGSAGLVQWDSPTTVEAWVRWPHPTSAQYLLSDEAWPEMAPDVLPTATKLGFALRRNARGDGRASLELTMAVAPDAWFSVESPPLAIRDDWEHVAATSDGSVLRLFRDGCLVAARSLPRTHLLPGTGNLSIGARQHGLANRVAELDLRALRITEGARYVEDFVPEQSLTCDDATILCPDFAPGNVWMGDRVDKARRHAIDGATWVSACTPAAVRDALASYGGGATTPIVIEAERGGRSAQWYLAQRDAQSEGLNVEIWSDQEPDEGGHQASVLVRALEAGRYRVHLLGPGLEHLGADGMVSPVSWRFDDGDAAMVAEPRATIRGIDGNAGAALSALGEVSLAAGEHVFHLRLLERRAHDGRYSLWFDALVLEPLP